jgi:hypothetical protein
MKALARITTGSTSAKKAKQVAEAQKQVDEEKRYREFRKALKKEF